MEIPAIEAPNHSAPSDAGQHEDAGNQHEEPNNPNIKPDAGEQDLTSPLIESVSPTNGSTAVETTTAIEFIFSEPIIQQSFQVAISPQVPLTTPSWSDRDTKATIHPTGALPFATTFTLTIRGTDLAGNSLQPLLLSFTTKSNQIDTTRPRLLTTTPSDGTKGVSTHTAIRLAFSEPMNKAKTERAFTITSPTTATSGTFSWDQTGQDMIFTPSTPFPSGTQITWTLAPTADDLSGNQLSAPTTQTFKTIQTGTVHIGIDFATTGSVGAPSYFLQTHYYNEVLVGKRLDNQNYRLFLGFKLDSLPATTTAIIQSQLIWKISTVAGSPFSKLGNLYLEPVDIGEELDLSFDTENPKTVADYNSPSLAGQLVIPPSSGPPLTLVSVTEWTASDWSNRTTRNNRTQYRLRFENTTHDNSIDALSSDSESSPGLAELIITYEFQ
ncbi:Ig-like domain-containing protein [Myxococcaceae bacterium JPH2]|nr:Ig-like domain-containing protein [Myxococcaceae bacterium JPH2]